MAVFTIQVSIISNSPCHACMLSYYMLPSGPKRYDYSEALDEWVYSRDERALSDLLNTELSEALGREVDLNIKGVSQQAS